MKASSRPGSLAYVCMDWRHMSELLAAAKSTALDMLNLCVWTKPNAGMGSLYRSQHELVFVFKLGAADIATMSSSAPTAGIAATCGPMLRDPALAGRAKRDGSRLCIRLSSRSAMVADAILDVTRRGDIVLDPFLGSGATLMACERTGRRCCGLELDPLYCDVIVRRWQAYTGGCGASGCDRRDLRRRVRRAARRPREPTRPRHERKNEEEQRHLRAGRG